MDTFEQVVGEILRREGYWVRTSVKVELTNEGKGTNPTRYFGARR